MEKQFYIIVKGEKIPVDEATYRAYKRPVWAEKKRKQRYTTEGVIPFSLDALMDDGFDIDDGTDLLAILQDKMLLDALFDALSELNPEEQSLIKDIFYFDKTEREIATGLGLSQKAVNKRKHKALDKLSTNAVLKRLYKNK